jgi:hypothetical protein
MPGASQELANLATQARRVTTHRIDGHSSTFVAVNKHEFERLMTCLAQAADAQ